MGTGSQESTPGIDPRGDLSSVDLSERDAHVLSIIEILSQDKDDYEIAEDLRAHVKIYLNPEPELFISVADELSRMKVLSKAQFRAYLSLEKEEVFDF